MKRIASRALPTIELVSVILCVLIGVTTVHAASIRRSSAADNPPRSEGRAARLSVQNRPLAPPVIFSPLSFTTTMNQPLVYQFEASGATELFVTQRGCPPG